MWKHIISSVRDEQKNFDSTIETWLSTYVNSGGHIYCAKGCSGCCNLTVNSTYPEAAAIDREDLQVHSSKLTNHIQRLIESAKQSKDWLTFLRKHRKDVGYCPFITSDGRCTIYSYRPFSCRALLSTRNSDWCTIDLSELPPIEKKLYLDSLDRNIVAYPVHYVDKTQSIGYRHEKTISSLMETAFGFSLSGNFALLVYLEMNYQLSHLVVEGFEETKKFLMTENLYHPYLLNLTKI